MASRLAVMSSRMAVWGQQPVCDRDDAVGVEDAARRLRVSASSVV